MEAVWSGGVASSPLLAAVHPGSGVKVHLLNV